jgi:hypothetical protein
MLKARVFSALAHYKSTDADYSREVGIATGIRDCGLV